MSDDVLGVDPTSAGEYGEVFNLTIEFMTDEELASLKLFEEYPDGLMIFASLCCVLFMVVGIPGNLITIVALSTYKKVRNATAIFIINLSCCDLLYCCFNLPLAASTFWLRSWPHGQLMCRLFPLARFGLAAVALFTVLGITTNRFIMISYPRLYPKLYKKWNLAAIIAVTWIFPFAVLIPTWLGKWGQFGMDPATELCSVLPDHENRSPQKLLFILAFIIPCLTITICYARIFYVVRKTTKNSRGTNPTNRRTVYEDSSIGVSNTIDNSPDTDNDTSDQVTIEHPRKQSLRIGSTPLSGPNSAFSISNLMRTKSFLPTARLRRSRPKDKSLPSSKDRRLLTMITAIMLSFFICHFPITLVKMITSFTSHHPVITILSYLVRYFITCINPIIYVVMSNEYRKAYKKLISSPPCDKLRWR